MHLEWKCLRTCLGHGFIPLAKQQHPSELNSTGAHPKELVCGGWHHGTSSKQDLGAYLIRQCHACGSLLLTENGYGGYWGDSETTLAIYLKHVICEIGWWFHRRVPNPNLSRCQLHKCGSFCVTQTSKAREQFDWQQSVSTASALSPCSLWIWNYLSLTLLTWPEALGPPEQLSFAFRFKKKSIIQFFTECSSILQRKIILWENILTKRLYLRTLDSDGAQHPNKSSAKYYFKWMIGQKKPSQEVILGTWLGVLSRPWLQKVSLQVTPPSQIYWWLLKHLSLDFFS